jgi:chitinase
MTRALASLALGLVLAAASGVHGSAATFTASARNGASVATASDWVAPAVALTTPADGAFLATTTPAFAGTTGDTTAVTVRVSSGSTVVQTRTATPAGGAWSTTATALANGQYTVQATQVDAAGNVGTTAVRTFTVDTVKPTASAVGATNKTGGTAGTLESGDAVAFTFSEPVDPTSVLSAWTGTSTAVRVRFTNSSSNDSFTVLDGSGGTGVHLGSVATAGDYVSGTVTFAATMLRSADGATCTITLGAPDDATKIRSAAVAAKTMTWTVGAGAKDRAGNAIATPATASETGLDVDF